MISSEGAIHLGADDRTTATLPQAMTREGDNETSARAARRKAGYVSFELEITFVTAYMILGIEKDVMLRGTWIFPSRGLRQIRQANEKHRDGSVTLSEPPTYQIVVM